MMIFFSPIQKGVNYHQPSRATSDSAGADLQYSGETPLSIPPGGTVKVSTGIKMAIPEGYFGLLCSRSGLGVNNRLVVSQGVGVIDSDYRGEVMIPITNFSQVEQIIQPKQKVAQLIIIPYAQVEYGMVSNSTPETLGNTQRGEGGFGSTGI